MALLIRNVILIGLLMQANFLWADIYRNQDANGNISFSDQSSDNATRVEPDVQSYRYKHQVAKVYDGDTIVLKNGEKVRLLGINTPEIESRYRQSEAGGQAAKKWLQDKLEQGQVFLEYDQQKRDKYKRLLAHLFLPSGEHLNKSLLEKGLAVLSIIPPNLRHVDDLIKAERQAQMQDLGIWSMVGYQIYPVSELSKETTTGWHRFSATPTKITESRKYIRLILDKNVDLRIKKSNLELFPKLDSYIGHPIEIRGWASRSKEHYSILVRHPSAIIVRP